MEKYFLRSSILLLFITVITINCDKNEDTALELDSIELNFPDRSELFTGVSASISGTFSGDTITNLFGSNENENDIEIRVNQFSSGDPEVRTYNDDTSIEMNYFLGEREFYYDSGSIKFESYDEETKQLRGTIDVELDDEVSSTPNLRVTGRFYVEVGGDN